MDFSAINSVLPLEMINKIMYENKGLTHPTATMIKELINDFEYMDGDYKTLDQKNEDEDDDDQIINTVVNIYDTEIKLYGFRMSYFLSNLFFNFGFENY